MIGEEVLIISGQNDGSLVYGVSHFIGKIGIVQSARLGHPNPYYDVNISKDGTFSFHPMDLIPLKRIKNKDIARLLLQY